MTRNIEFAQMFCDLRPSKQMYVAFAQILERGNTKLDLSASSFVTPTDNTQRNMYCAEANGYGITREKSKLHLIMKRNISINSP